MSNTCLHLKSLCNEDFGMLVFDSETNSNGPGLIKNIWGSVREYLLVGGASYCRTFQRERYNHCDNECY